MMDSNTNFFYTEFMDLSSTDEDDYEDEIMMMQSFIEDAKHAEEHVLNSKRSIKGRQVLNLNKT